MVGDEVRLGKINDQFVVVDIFDRTNALIRPRVANVDIVILVCSIVQPNFNSLALSKSLAFMKHVILSK